ncbi:hypothetical protein C7B65_25720 [Phormidesmis priestleyi ULC007]|uniref:Uncharacterized protein n=1 Tax=Phormidesmis priestleyi ULC007 TaxID=1920490 RepID=A0A2T1D386_9CYAN|nr:hypothetical protein [Phormidesmis priestleyi]PSB14864.1 hypothetical protein C7B65_25720 [Phormidesmis priestleyi ULC007]PZO45858.1 MAG: hypothetical protein DCF14_24520 [Phormidesmis priestleyi]
MSNLIPPNSAAKVQAELVVDAISKLEALPQKTPTQKRELTTRETVSAMYGTLAKLRFEKGYSFDEIADFLKEMIGLDVSPKTLHNYFAEETKSRKKSARQQNRRSRGTDSPAIAQRSIETTLDNSGSTSEPESSSPSVITPDCQLDSSVESDSSQFDLQQAEIPNDSEEAASPAANALIASSEPLTNERWVEPEFNTIQTRPKKRRS